MGRDEEANRLLRVMRLVRVLDRFDVDATFVAEMTDAHWDAMGFLAGGSLATRSASPRTRALVREVYRDREAMNRESVIGPELKER